MTIRAKPTPAGNKISNSFLYAIKNRELEIMEPGLSYSETLKKYQHIGRFFCRTDTNAPRVLVGLKIGLWTEI